MNATPETKPDIFYVLVCRECAGGESPLPFPSAAERGKWAAEHTAGTGHNTWFIADQPAGRPVESWVLTSDGKFRPECHCTDNGGLVMVENGQCTYCGGIYRETPVRVATAPEIDEPARLALNDLHDKLAEMANTARRIAKRLDGR